jgi:hypothetical protein
MLKLLMMFGLSFATLTRALSKLSHLVRTLTIDNIKSFLKNQESPYMIALLGLSLLWVTWDLVVLLLILIMNLLNNYCMLLMIMCGVWKSLQSADFATLDTWKLFSKFKSYELSHKCHPNHNASFTSKALITSARVGGRNANSTNTISPSLEFAFSSLAATSDE